ncbi:Pex12 amino terminal region-domain-containing protein [Irpex rosettiformis]|uniref:Pex12 amino terminal region-domain-containing protein n=1 Tax=Irpex rosettiformis TaxID=378272 RepID=A0ACB8U6X0_9APHY|nr:Pex12 amino terminal region-domain-containing protein [Irpex rosettiformis]
MTVPSFPFAQQAAIIRSNQRDIFHVSSLREQADNVLRAWFGTRWLSRWDKEIGLLVQLTYYGLTVGQATQTLGEEYTGIWPHSTRTDSVPTISMRAALILLPTLPRYIVSKWGSSLPPGSKLSSLLKRLPSALEVLTEVNLAVFYLRGTYYHLVRRLLGTRYVASMPPNPNARPPSYSLLGILLGIRLLHRLVTFLRELREANKPIPTGRKRLANDSYETFVDDQPVSSLLGPYDPDDQPVVPAEEDERTILDVTLIPSSIRTGRSCTLCLEERTASCATECGHMFCWSCIVGWGREKAECPLCRQSLSITKLLPIYNL